MTSPPANRQRTMFIVTAVLAVLILVPSGVGFVNKLFEFYGVIKGEASGAFAFTPVVNYLLASMGFLCLMLWAIGHGMFHDIERPKQTMLETERMLDEQRATEVDS